MAGLLDMLGKTASDAVNKAGSKAEELMEVKQYRDQQNQLKVEVSKAKRDCYDYVYKQYQDGEVTDEGLIELLKKVEALIQEYKDLNVKIDQVHENARAKQEDYDGERL